MKPEIDFRCSTIAKNTRDSFYSAVLQYVNRESFSYLEIGFTMERSNVINMGIIGVLRQLLLQVVEQLNEEQEVFTKEEAAAFLNIKVSTLERLAFRKNEIGYTKPDRHAVFLKRDLLKFLENRRIPSVYDEGV
jgi:hypothetical protein